jgi:hypothetical protein
MDTRDLPMLFAAAIVMFMMYLIGWSNCEYNMRVEAVKANVAYWTVNEKGSPKFHWIKE